MEILDIQNIFLNLKIYDILNDTILIKFKNNFSIETLNHFLYLISEGTFFSNVVRPNLGISYKICLFHNIITNIICREIHSFDESF